MTTIPVAVVDEQDIVTTPQTPLGLHTDKYMVIQEITYTIVVYVTTLPLVTQGLPRYITLNMEAPLEWNEKDEIICWSRHNLK